VVELLGLPCKAPTVRRVDKGDPDIAYVHGALAGMDQDGTMIYFYKPTLPTTVVLHELAHLTVTDPLDHMELRKPEEGSDHGPIWLGNYLWLLDKLMGPSYNSFYLRNTMPALMQPQALPFHPIIWGKPKVGL
jgi:hypothetical protein